MFLLNLLALPLVSYGIYYFVDRWDMNYTLHDESNYISVDWYYDMPVEDAIAQIESKGLVAEVDSVFIVGYEPGIVILQDPMPTDSAGAQVKSGRIIKLKVQAKIPPGKVIPKVHGFSRRIVESKLLSRGLKPKAKLVDAPDTYVQQKHVLVNGKEVFPGEMVPLGSEVIFFVGRGKAKPVEIPVLEGMTISEATKRLSSASLIFHYAGCESCITAEDSLSAVVVRQSPKGGKGLYAGGGSEITVWFDIHPKIDAPE